MKRTCDRFRQTHPRCADNAKLPSLPTFRSTSGKLTLLRERMPERRARKSQKCNVWIQDWQQRGRICDLRQNLVRLKADKCATARRSQYIITGWYQLRTVGKRQSATQNRSSDIKCWCLSLLWTATGLCERGEAGGHLSQLGGGQATQASPTAATERNSVCTVYCRPSQYTIVVVSAPQTRIIYAESPKVAVLRLPNGKQSTLDGSCSAMT
eukprot:6196982-Pleurochrysis_carterae.AAC.1